MAAMQFPCNGILVVASNVPIFFPKSSLINASFLIYHYGKPSAAQLHNWIPPCFSYFTSYGNIANWELLLSFKLLLCSGEL